MKAADRIYVITPTREGPGPRLVRAAHPSTALRHVTADAYKVTVATQDELVRLVKAGVAVEDVKAEPEAD